MDFTSFCSEEILLFRRHSNSPADIKAAFALSQTTKDVRVVGFVAPLVARLHVQYSTITTTSPHKLVFFACGCSLKGKFTGTTEPLVT